MSFQERRGDFKKIIRTTKVFNLPLSFIILTFTNYPLLSLRLLCYPLLSFVILYYPLLSFTILCYPLLSLLFCSFITDKQQKNGKIGFCTLLYLYFLEF